MTRPPVPRALVLALLACLGYAVPARAQGVAGASRQDETGFRLEGNTCLAARDAIGGPGPAALLPAIAPVLPRAGATGATPLVQVVYLVPSGRVENPLYTRSLDHAIRHLQRWYWDRVPGGKT